MWLFRCAICGFFIAQNMAVLHCETGHIVSRNGPYRAAERPESENRVYNTVRMGHMMLSVNALCTYPQVVNSIDKMGYKVRFGGNYRGRLWI